MRDISKFALAIIGTILIISTLLIFVSWVQYDLGFYGESYKDGEYTGYNSHNESIYNASLEYAYLNLPHVGGGVRGSKDAFYYAYGYVDGYEKYLLDYKNSWLIEEMENGPDMSMPQNVSRSQIKIEKCNDSAGPFGNYDVEFYTVNEHGESTLALLTCLIYGERYNVSFGDHKETIYITSDKYYLFDEL